VAAVLASLAFLSLLLLFNSIIVATQDSRENRERQRLLKYIRRLDSGGSGASAAGGIATARKAVEGFFSRLLKGRASESWLASQLELSDVPLKASEFAAINGAVACAAGLLARMLGGDALRVLAALALGTVSPLVYLRLRTIRKARRFSAQLADALVLISGSLRAGHSFLQALEVAARETSPPASREFARVIKELSLGAPFEDALTNLGRRVGSKDLELVIIAVLIQRQVGGNLAELLDTVAETIRERVRVQGEIRTLTAQGRISGFIISVLPVVLAGIMSVLNPGYLSELTAHPLGRLALVCSGCSMLIGVWMVNRIARIEV
jgi:tight adherence protein B